MAVAEAVTAGAIAGPHGKWSRWRGGTLACSLPEQAFSAILTLSEACGERPERRLWVSQRRLSHVCDRSQAVSRSEVLCRADARSRLLEVRDDIAPPRRPSAQRFHLIPQIKSRLLQLVL